MVVVLIAYGLILIKSLVWYYAWNDDFNRQLNFNDFMIHLSLYFKEEQRLESSLKRCHEFTRTIQPIKRLMKDLDCSQDKTSMLLQFHSHYLWRTLVTIILNHEEYGDQNLDLRIESVTADILKLSQNVRSFQKDLFSFVKKLDIATGLSTILALLSKNMLNQTINLDSNSSYQTAMTLFLLSNLMILLLNHSVFKTKAVFKEECL
ncbi:hypothetical protein [Erysipelothrix urinaevulpis]|nr:hypothetical protein [Erysipelothrix urinaevulpis]